MAVNIDDLLGIIGAKEAELFDLRRDFSKLVKEHQALLKKSQVSPQPTSEVTDVEAQ